MKTLAYLVLGSIIGFFLCLVLVLGQEGEYDHFLIQLKTELKHEKQRFERAGISFTPRMYRSWVLRIKEKED